MSNWVRVGRLPDCPPGASRELLAGERVVALFNCDGTLSALDGVCPHQGGPLGEGELCGTTVTCPWHGWQFDVRTGQHRTSSSVRQPTLDVKIEGDEVWVDVGP
jgi:nitrite reductase/ring-hydroxylating ferredoxin subunit